MIEFNDKKQDHFEKELSNNRNWKNIFQEKTNISKLFKCISYKNPKNQTMELVFSDDTHSVLIVTTENKESVKKKVLIMCIPDCPNWKHMMDLTFKYGDDFDRRILIIDGEYENYNIDLDYNITIGFAQLNNLFKKNTEIVYLYEKELNDNKIFQFFRVGMPKLTRKMVKTKVFPTKEQLQEHEFFFYIDFYDPRGEPNYEVSPENWSFGSNDCHVGIENYLSWTKEGLFHYFDIHNNSGEKLLKSFIVKHYAEIYRLIKNYQVSISTDSGPNYRIGIKLSNEPLDTFSNASNNEKVEYAEKIFDSWVELANLYSEHEDEEYRKNHTKRDKSLNT